MKVNVLTGYPKVEIISESKIKLVSPIEVKIEFDNAENGSQLLYLTIPAGFECDGASMPCGTWSLLDLHPLHPDIIVGAIVHDYIYRTKTIMISREEADRIFIKLCKCNFVKRAILYSSVRLAGGKFYKKRHY